MILVLLLVNSLGLKFPHIHNIAVPCIVLSCQSRIVPASATVLLSVVDTRMVDCCQFFQDPYYDIMTPVFSAPF